MKRDCQSRLNQKLRQEIIPGYMDLLLVLLGRCFTVVTLGWHKILQVVGSGRRQREPVYLRLDIKVIQKRRLSQISEIDLERY